MSRVKIQLMNQNNMVGIPAGACLLDNDHNVEITPPRTMVLNLSLVWVTAETGELWASHSVDEQSAGRPKVYKMPSCQGQ